MSSAYTLFVGDLSIYCTKEDIEKAFSPFGNIKDIRIKKDEQTGKYLSYGFVEFEEVSAAVSALQNMNGYVLCGRPMRMRWATNKSKKSYSQPAQQPEVNETSAVHVTYMTLNPNVVVTEESLRNLFSSYGLVLDATVKKSVVNQDQSGRRGYGFVHFANSQSGVESAIKAATALTNTTIENVNYRCSMSKNFEQRLNAMMTHYRTLSPVEAYSMNCYFYNQHQQQAMMYAAALAQQMYTQQMYSYPCAVMPNYFGYSAPSSGSSVSASSTTSSGGEIPDEENQLCALTQELSFSPSQETKSCNSESVEIKLPAAKPVPEVYSAPAKTLTSTIDALQNQLDQLRSTCGIAEASAPHFVDEFSMEPEDMVHCVALCDY